MASTITIAGSVSGPILVTGSQTRVGVGPATVPPPPATPPVISSAMATAPTPSGVTVVAAIQPGGLQTSYQVNYGSDTTYSGGTSGPFLLPADFLYHFVSVPVAGLASGTLYHYDVVASNSAGTRRTPDDTFQTTVPPPPPPPTGPYVAQTTGQVCAPSLVNSLTSANFGSPVRAGSTLFLVVAHDFDGTQAVAGVVDTSGNSGWGQLGVVYAGYHLGMEVWWARNVVASPAGLHATVSLSKGSYATIFGTFEVPNLGTNPILDVPLLTNSWFNPSPPQPNTGALSTNNAVDFVLTAFAATVAAAITSPANYTVVGSEATDGQCLDGEVDYRMTSSALGSHTPTWTVTGLSNEWCALAAAIKSSNVAQAAPAISVGTPTALTTTGATLNAAVNPNGAQVTSLLVEYGSSTAYGSSSAFGTLPADIVNHPVSLALTGLGSGVTYHYRWDATNSGGTTRSADGTFATLQPPPPAPAVTVNATSNIGSASAAVNATVNPNGASATLTVEYGLTSGYGTSVAAGSLGADTINHAVAQNLTSLAANTTYHFRWDASNSGGTTQSGDNTFTTSPNAPAVAVTGTTSITTTSAAVNATVNPNGASATLTVEYGLTSGYGSSVGAGSLPADNANHFATQSLSGLTLNTTYHFRWDASNSGGTTQSGDNTFTTAPQPVPTIMLAAPTGITTNAATVNADINPNGGAVSSVSVSYGPTSGYGTNLNAGMLPGDSSTHAVAQPISGLSPDTDYHYQFQATNGGGTAFSADGLFHTTPLPPPPPAPAIGNVSVNPIGSTTATVNATITSQNTAASSSVEFGTSTAYGSGSGTVSVAGDGLPHAATYTLAGLSPSTSYHARVDAANLAGLTLGTDVTFTTAAASTSFPMVGGVAVQGFGDTFATVGGTVNPEGGSTTVAVLYGSDTTYLGGNVSAGTLPADTNPHSASATLTPLTASTLYHYTMRASNPSGSVQSVDQTFRTSGPAPPNVIGQQDLQYLGYFNVSDNVGASMTYASSMTVRRRNGQNYLLILGYYIYLIEIQDPGIYDGSYTVNTATGAWQDIFANAQNCGPDPARGGFDYSVGWDEANQLLWTGQGVTYPTIGFDSGVTQGVYCRTLNADGTISGIRGPWGMNGVSHRNLAGGMAKIPAYFQANYGTGPFAFAGIGYDSEVVTGGVCSLGPVAFAWPDPRQYPDGANLPDNAWKTLVDYRLATTTNDWYTNNPGAVYPPPSFDRARRVTLNYVNNFDIDTSTGTSYWEPPAPDGYGRSMLGDHNWTTMIWPDLTNKRGVLWLRELGFGDCGYTGSYLHYGGKLVEWNVYDPLDMGRVAQDLAAPWSIQPAALWQDTNLSPVIAGHTGGSQEVPTAQACVAAQYEPVSKMIYVLIPYPGQPGAQVHVYQLTAT